MGKLTLISVSNSKLEKDGIVSINMPPILTCPGAGNCKKYCYACVGLQAMGKPKEFRLRALALFKGNPKLFKQTLEKEIHRVGRRIIRWHDSGDIQNISYLKIMVALAKFYPDIRFYTYTKSHKIVQKFGFENLPANLKIIQSYGGKHDHLIDPRYPIAKVFAKKEDFPKGYTDCSESDYPAATTATKIAILAHGGRSKRFQPQEE